MIKQAWEVAEIVPDSSTFKPENHNFKQKVSQTSIHAMFSLKPTLIPCVRMMYIICTTEKPKEHFKKTWIDHV
jgi:hypothetical protein